MELVVSTGSGKPRCGGNRKVGQWKENGFWHRSGTYYVCILRRCSPSEVSLPSIKMGMLMLTLEYFCEEKIS